jgi:hypothetical protein
MARQRISYIPLGKMDAAMREEMERCAREGTPRPESTAVRAHVPAVSMAPGFETAEALARTKASPDYWAKQDAAPKKKRGVTETGE